MASNNSIQNNDFNKNLLANLNGEFTLKIKGNLSNKNFNLCFCDNHKGIDNTVGNMEITFKRENGNLILKIV